MHVVVYKRQLVDYELAYWTLARRVLHPLKGTVVSIALDWKGVM